MRIRVGLLALLVTLLLASGARAHGMRSAYLEILEQSPGQALVTFRLSVRAPGVAPRLPEGCVVQPVSAGGGSLLARCDAPLAGARVAIDGLGPDVGEGVVWVTLADGQTVSHLLTASAPSWIIPARATRWETARRYVGLGVAHIEGGADHLLFLVLLVLTVRRPRAVLLAETAFTLSHSLAFAANALGWLVVSSAAAEACIALSLLLLALDVERPDRRGSAPPPAWQGAGVALVFGAVHGLGFAGGLREAGLPEAHVGAALLGFGLGVEIAQVTFVVGVLALVVVLGRVGLLSRVARVTAYAAGVVASFWLFERLALAWGLS